MVDPADDGVAYTNDFADVLKKEYAAAWRRRPAAEQEKAGEKARSGELRPPALYGVALSGGGIRSASFCLGALQALDQEKLVGRIDYLSTVSGGGYTGASMIAGMCQNGGKFPFSLGSGDDIHDNEPVNHIRDNSRFLAPRGLYDVFISLAVILRGLMVNFLLVLSVLLPLATFMILVNPTEAHLERSIVLDIVLYWFPGFLVAKRVVQFGRTISCRPISADQDCRNTACVIVDRLGAVPVVCRKLRLRTCTPHSGARELGSGMGPKADRVAADRRSH